MIKLKGYLQSLVFFFISIALFLFPGCDSGEKTVDGLTGNQAVKEYQETKEDIDNIVETQNVKLDSIDEADEEDDDLIFEEDEE